MSAEPTEVLFELLAPGVALVTLNRPEAANAINAAVTDQLERARRRVETDPGIRVAILIAAGEKVFCAGADLKEISCAGGPSGLSTEEGGFAGFVRAPRSKPWIAAVGGKAFGGGFELVLACDMVVTGQSAEFALPEAKIGVLAAAGGAFRIAQVLPKALANELLVTGKALSAERAHALGIVNRLVADDAVLDTALQLALEVIRCAPLSVQASLDIVSKTADLDEAGRWQLNDQWVQRIVSSADAQEGPRSFLQKRSPVWSGV